MHNYLIYLQATGQILRLVNCAEDHIELQLADGEDYLEFDPKEINVDDRIHCVKDGETIEIIAGWSADAAHLEYDWQLGQWIDRMAPQVPPRDRILRQIAGIEAVIARPLREIALAAAAGRKPDATALKRVTQADAEIQALRAQLHQA